MELPVELFRIVISETSPQQVIVLKEKGGDRSFPIVIGVHEAVAIKRRIKRRLEREKPGVRPFTYDLLALIIEAMGGRLEKIVINDLRDSTFIAKLVIQRDGEAIEVDSRPSDAIALGSAFDTPIFVAEHVFEQVVKDTLDLASQREGLQLQRDRLLTGIAELQEHLDDRFVLLDDADEEKKAIVLQLREMRTQLEAIEEILRYLPE